MLSDRIGGIISIILGAISISEAVRLYPERMTTYIGDHTLPAFVGAAFVLLGTIILFVKGQSFKVEFPRGKGLRVILGIMGALFVYWLIIDYLGYMVSTFLVSIFLFKLVGSYNWVKSTVYSAIQVAAIYLVFVYWLEMPFPVNIFNF